MTADGRVSLKSHLAGPRATPLATQFRTKVFKKDLYPLAACVGGAVVLGSGFAMRRFRFVSFFSCIPVRPRQTNPNPNRNESL